MIYFSIFIFHSLSTSSQKTAMIFVTNLLAASEYEFCVSALNQHGNSSLSMPSNPIITTGTAIASQVQEHEQEHVFGAGHEVSLDLLSLLFFSY